MHHVVHKCSSIGFLKPMVGAHSMTKDAEGFQKFDAAINRQGSELR